MLYLFYGPGPKQDKVKKFLGNIPGEVLKITDLDFDQVRLEELISAQGLFTDRLTVLLDNVITSEEIEKNIENFLEDLAESKNTFIFIQNEISPDLLLGFKEKGEVYSTLVKKDTRSDFSIFNLTDSFGRKDKKKAWLFFLEAISELPPEEIAQMIFWQIKTMTLVKSAKNGSSLGLNPYVAKKAALTSQNFSSEELKNLSRKIIAVFHENRRTDRDLAIDLEKFILQSL
ncbi:MAG TPA: hypothetical protein VJ103_02330 [Candidatus Paceibacterota bacterium]|nr:hypothetical protein [Candidatus Paceibacterota bacterium]